MDAGPRADASLGSGRFRQFELSALVDLLSPIQSNPAAGRWGEVACGYIDPNPITNLNNEGHNYFLSQNPYVLNSYAGFGEAYYNVTHDLKLTGGLRWTDDQKAFHRHSQRTARAGLRLSRHRRRRSAMEPVDRPLRRQLDAEARFHRSDAGLCILCAWLQGRRRQSAGRSASAAFASTGDIIKSRSIR